MEWTRHTLRFRLESPLHIGYRKLGNLKQTRGYIPGKVLWGALTARLARDYTPARPGDYQRIGQELGRTFCFGYLYPALCNRAAGTWTILHPWNRECRFAYRLLDSYASTALDYGRGAAQDNSLHETEYIRTRTRCLDGEDPEPVYFTGELYIELNRLHEAADSPLEQWQEALNRMVLGSEKKYGWGRIREVDCTASENMVHTGNRPQLQIEKDTLIPAHLAVPDPASSAQCRVHGHLEPLLGWEYRDDGWRLSAPTLCFQPGARAVHDLTLVMDAFGILRLPSTTEQGRE